MSLYTVSSMLLPQISAESVNSSNIKLPFPKYHINMEDDGYYSAFSADDDDDDLTDQEMQSQSNKYRKRSHSHRYSRRIEVNEESKKMVTFNSELELKNHRSQSEVYKHKNQKHVKSATDNVTVNGISYDDQNKKSQKNGKNDREKRPKSATNYDEKFDIFASTNTNNIKSKSQKQKHVKTDTNSSKALSLLTGHGQTTKINKFEPNSTQNNEIFQIPQMTQWQSHNSEYESAASSVDIGTTTKNSENGRIQSTHSQKQLIQIQQNEEIVNHNHTKSLTENNKILKAKTYHGSPQFLKREKFEKERIEKLAEKRKKAAATKKMLEEDLDNFQFDQWKKHCIAQTFSLPTLESAFKKYYQHNHVVLIKLYIVGYFFGNIAVFAFYDIWNIQSQFNQLLTLFVRAFTAIFLCIFGYLFWSKRLVERQNDAMIVFNLFIAICALIVSGLGGEPGHGAFIIIMFCVHLFSGISHLKASAICWFVVFGFAIVSAIVTQTRSDYTNIGQIYWYTYANTASYLVLTSSCLSVMGMFLEFSARRQFYQRKKLQHEKKKSWKALSTLLPPDVAKSLQQGRRVAVAFRYEPHHPKHRGVSVGFIQICDFHKLVSKLPSRNLVSMLNTIFTKWDDIASLQKVFKVETINEIYMVAGGLPYPRMTDTNYSHPVRMVFFANDVMNYCHEVLEVLVPESMNDFDDENEQQSNNEQPKGPQGPRESLLPHSYKTTYTKIVKKTITLQIRIGLNIGYVVAGVIGKKLPRYRLFGDTVNTASRMESTCGPRQIQMTANFHKELPAVFHQFTTKRENVKVKGKGQMTTYLLSKIDRNKPIEVIEKDGNEQNNGNEEESMQINIEQKVEESIQSEAVNNESGTGFFGLITRTEDEEEESSLMDENAQNGAAMSGNNHSQAQILKNLNIKIDLDAFPKDAPTHLSFNSTQLKQQKLHLNSASKTTTEPLNFGGGTPIGKRKGRKMKLIGSRKNLLANEDGSNRRRRSLKKSQKSTMHIRTSTPSHVRSKTLPQHNAGILTTREKANSLAMAASADMSVENNSDTRRKSHSVKSSNNKITEIKQFANRKASVNEDEFSKSDLSFSEDQIEN